VFPYNYCHHLNCGNCPTSSIKNTRETYLKPCKVLANVWSLWPFSEENSYRLIVVKHADKLLVADLSSALLVDGVKHGVEFIAVRRELCPTTVSYSSWVTLNVLLFVYSSISPSTPNSEYHSLKHLAGYQIKYSP